MTNHPETLFNEIAKQAGYVRIEHDGRPAIKFSLWDVRQAEHESDEAGVEQFVYDLVALWAEWLQGAERFPEDMWLEVEVAGWETGELKIVLLPETCPHCERVGTGEVRGDQMVCTECGAVWWEQ